MNTCVVFAAHPDDETNGVGGTILRLREAGWSIHLVYATFPVNPELESKRSTACWKVASAVKATFEMWGYPDGKLDEHIAHAKDTMQRVYANARPDLVLVMNPSDVHPDHRAMAHLAMGPALQRGVNTEIMLYELCASGRHIDGDRPQTLAHLPTHYVDTTEVIDQVACLQSFHDTEDPEAMIRGMRNVHANRAK